MKSRKDILITKADKGNVVVLLDKTDYNRKIDGIFKKGTYTQLPSDPTDLVRKSLLSIMKTFIDEASDPNLSGISKHLRFSSN